MDFVERNGQVQKYRDRQTGQVVYLGSTRPSEDRQEFEAIEAVAKRALDLDQLADKARRDKDAKLGAAVFAELSMQLAPAIQKLCIAAKFHCGFAHFAQGLVYRVLGQPIEAETCLRKSLSFNPAVINTLLELTRCLGELGRLAEAEQFARKAVETEPGSAAAWGNLAMSLIQLRRRQEAREALDRAIALDPSDKINRYIAQNFDAYFRNQ